MMTTTTLSITSPSFTTNFFRTKPIWIIEFRYHLKVSPVTHIIESKQEIALIRQCLRDILELNPDIGRLLQTDDIEVIQVIEGDQNGGDDYPENDQHDYLQYVLSTQEETDIFLQSSHDKYKPLLDWCKQVGLITHTPVMDGYRVATIENEIYQERIKVLEEQVTILQDRLQHIESSSNKITPYSQS
jgi:hypothetical protein